MRPAGIVHRPSGTLTPMCSQSQPYCLPYSDSGFRCLVCALALFSPVACTYQAANTANWHLLAVALEKPEIFWLFEVDIAQGLMVLCAVTVMESLHPTCELVVHEDWDWVRSWSPAERL